MKLKFLVILVGMFFSNNAYSQDIVNMIKDFYKNADMNCYIEQAKERTMEEYHINCQVLIKNFYIPYCQRYPHIPYCQEYEKSRDSTKFPLPLPPLSMNLSQKNVIPILNIQFVSTENYSHSNNIYDYITIDSVWVFSFAYVDKKMNVYAGINFAAPHGSYYIVSNLQAAYKKTEQESIKKFKKYKPEFILYCAGLERGFGKRYIDGYMYIKDNKIYKIHNGNSYELNDFIRNYMHLDNIHHDLSFSHIPPIYQKNDESTRRTGNAPENEKMICPLRSP